MQAIILAAGCGNRLGRQAAGRPKSLLEFGGKSLLERHIETLRARHIERITLVIGYQAEQIRAHLQGGPDGIDFIFNPRFQEGSGLSLAAAGEVIGKDPQFILMDADVLHDPRLIRRLLDSPAENCFLLDQDFIPGIEPVKLCVNASGQIIEFAKERAQGLDYVIEGESVGFFKFSRATGRRLIARIDHYQARGRHDTPYEAAIRDLVLCHPDRFGYEDVTGIPWIEIDFPEDIARAQREILPRLQ